jgi:acetyltransferase-like isoleucine patch superfamily enzyme
MKRGIETLWQRPELAIWLLRGLITQLLRFSFRGIILMERGASIHGLRNLRLKGALKLGRYSVLDVRNCQRAEIGNMVSIGAFSVVRTSGAVDFMCPHFVLGDNVSLGPYCNVGGGFGLTIGRDVVAGPYVSIHPESHSYGDLMRPIREQGVRGKGIVIGNDCWIGAKATILDGTVLQSGCVVGAAAVLGSTETMENGIYVGGRATLLKTRNGAG